MLSSRLCLALLSGPLSRISVEPLFLPMLRSAASTASSAASHHGWNLTSASSLFSRLFPNPARAAMARARCQVSDDRCQQGLRKWLETLLFQPKVAARLRIFLFVFLLEFGLFSHCSLLLLQNIFLTIWLAPSHLVWFPAIWLATAILLAPSHTENWYAQSNLAA